MTRRRTVHGQARAALLGAALLLVGAVPTAAKDPPAGSSPAVDLGALTFSVEGPRRVTRVVGRVTLLFDGPEEEGRDRSEAGIPWFRDAAHGAVRETRPAEVAGDVDVAAIERRLHRAISRRATGLGAVRFEVLGVRIYDRW